MSVLIEILVCICTLHTGSTRKHCLC